MREVQGHQHAVGDKDHKAQEDKQKGVVVVYSIFLPGQNVANYAQDQCPGRNPCRLRRPNRLWHAFSFGQKGPWPGRSVLLLFVLFVSCFFGCVLGL